MAFNHIFNNGTGNYYLCCHTSSNVDFEQKPSILSHTPFEHFFSDDMNNVREKMINGDYIESCKNCYMQELAGIRSHRQKYIEMFGKVDMVGRYMAIKVSFSGNYCNLSCYMCHPNHSSKRTKELIAIGEGDQPHWTWQGKDFKITRARFKEIAQDIVDHSDILCLIQFSTDGEPLQHPRMYELLKMIPDHHAKDISIGITTNLSMTRFNEYSLDDIISRYRSVSLRVSCDHIDEKYNWIRHGGSFETLNNNIDKYSAHIKTIAPAIGILNVFDLDEMETWWNSKGYSVWSNPSYVYSPSFMSMAKCIDNSAKEMLIEKYTNDSRAEELIYALNKADYSDKSYKKMVRYMDKLSVGRGDWRKLWKEYDI